MSGKFIIFEGVDNSGKTVISKAILEWLEDHHNIRAVLTRHPGSTPVGKQIRQILKRSEEPMNATAQGLLFAADNSMFMEQVLKPNIEAGKWVLGDRNNFISSCAYQIASGCSWEGLDKIHASTGATNKIDLLLIFRCDYEESQRRRLLKGAEAPDRFEDAGKEYFDKLANCYEQLIEKQSARLAKFVNFKGNCLNCQYIDASKTQDEVFHQVMRAIEETFDMGRIDLSKLCKSDGGRDGSGMFM